MSIIGQATFKLERTLSALFEKDEYQTFRSQGTKLQSGVERILTAMCLDNLNPESEIESAHVNYEMKT